MPELPEVESVVLVLREEVLGDTIDALTVLWPKWLPAGAERRTAHALAGRRLQDFSRRGKYILFGLDDGSLLISHLRMTGRWLVQESGAPTLPHRSAVLGLRSGRCLVFQDVRKFGRAAWYPRGTQPPELAATGREPLDPALTPRELYALLHPRKRDLKALLLDQSCLAGLGNIYVSEILFRAGINPFVQANQLSLAEVERFHAAMQAILEQAIAERGTTVYDYRGARNVAGNYQTFLQVYQRHGLPCAVCGSMILRAVQGQRATFFCPTCQQVGKRLVKAIAAQYSQRRHERRPEASVPTP